MPRVLLPGQREFETRADRERHGIPRHSSVVRTFTALAADLGIPAPELAGERALGDST